MAGLSLLAAVIIDTHIHALFCNLNSLRFKALRDWVVVIECCSARRKEHALNAENLTRQRERTLKVEEESGCSLKAISRNPLTKSRKYI
jgi:hypothetical protein